MKAEAAIIIPAYNESDWIETTLRALRAQANVSFHTLIVVDDGSEDHTAHVAGRWADAVIRLPRNGGKGAALWQGVQAVPHERLLFLDADLGETAVHAVQLLDMLDEGACEMAVACPPPALRGG
ncbi:glycosyltransferase family 2 protein, partial [Acinetobacter baumannii]|uniref:glycosyltransferase family 2 protein n=1 Tax=Acinetobacter baumannii TaxID=470 RepID=UPI001969A67A